MNTDDRAAPARGAPASTFMALLSVFRSHTPSIALMSIWFGSHRGLLLRRRSDLSGRSQFVSQPFRARMAVIASFRVFCKIR